MPPIEELACFCYISGSILIVGRGRQDDGQEVEDGVLGDLCRLDGGACLPHRLVVRYAWTTQLAGRAPGGGCTGLRGLHPLLGGDECPCHGVGRSRQPEGGSVQV